MIVYVRWLRDGEYWVPPRGTWWQRLRLRIGVWIMPRFTERLEIKSSISRRGTVEVGE